MPAPLPTSLIDRVDDADRPVGEIERARVFEEHANFRVAHVFVFNGAGALLLQRLGAVRDRHPGLWGSSVAGYLHKGETYAEAAGRRLMEELGLETPLVKHGGTWMLDEGCRKFIDLYLTTTDEAQIKEPGHIEAIEFRTLDQIQTQMRLAPEAFTETFRHLFVFYLGTAILLP